MVLDLWTKTSGTWINIFTVLIGTSIGLILGDRLPKTIQQIITQGIGLLTVWLGLNMANSITKVTAARLDGAILALLAIVVGGVLGELFEIETRLNSLGNWLKKRFRSKGLFTEGFVASSLLFCVGPMTLLGCLNNGLTGDNTILTIKATMDGIVSIALANIYGIGVGFSALVLLIYQGGLSLGAAFLANSLPDPANDPHIFLITGVGGLIIVGIGINLLEITKIKVASFLPALIIAPLFYRLSTIGY